MSDTESRVPIIEMSGIHKSFGSVRAVSNARFELRGGEIHSLIGENGAGKSTLMKILYGVHEPDEGVIRVRGAEHRRLSPSEAIGLDIGMVHQEFMLVGAMTVLENVILGFEPRKGHRIDFAEARRRIAVYADSYGLRIQPDKLAKDISVGEAQRVEIIKALYRGAKILILDEPTAVLTPQEAQTLFGILGRMRADGKSIVFISHKLREVMAISDRITIMRQGESLSTVDRGATSIPELARLMVGREVFLSAPEPTGKPAGKPVLAVEGIFVPGEKELSKLRGVSFEVREGEILGLAGVDGNGQSELVEAIAGLRPVERGRILLGGREVQNRSPLRIRRAGLSHIPEDRNARGIDRALTIEENLLGRVFRRRPYSMLGVIRERVAKPYARSLVERFDIRPASIDAPADSLSGGNAQKVVIAREMEGSSPFLLAAQPTRGVDVGAIERIREELAAARKAGAAVLLVSADLEEIISLSDRIAVMYEGRITGIVGRQDATEERLGLLMTGGASDAARLG